MTEQIKNFLSKDSGNTEIILFIAQLCIVLAAFIIFLMLSLFKKEFGFLKRLWYICFCCGTIISQAALQIAAEQRITLCFCSLGIVLACASILFCFNTKKEKTSKADNNYLKNECFDGCFDEKSVQKAITDNKTKNRFDEQNSKNESDLNKTADFIVEHIKTEVKPAQKQKNDIDYSHVKSIISKLGYYGLSASDKRLISELETFVVEAENGDDRVELKRKINEGLGALLKIMAKYGA